MAERVSAADWQQQEGHVARYRWVAERLVAGEVVNDVACGVGYGALVLGSDVIYHGWDRPGIPAADRFAGQFHAADLNRHTWRPTRADVTVCFETLEHVENPGWLALVLASTTRRAIAVSVPTEPTKHINPWHRHDFDVEEIPPLFGEQFRVVERWAQPEELAHVWWLERRR